MRYRTRSENSAGGTGSRWIVGVGVFAGVALGVGVSAFGDTPDPRWTTDEISNYFVHHRTEVFVGVVLLGIASMAVLVVVSGLATNLHARGLQTTARVVQSSATVAVSAILAGMVLPYAGLSYIIGAEAPQAAKGLFALTILATPVCAVPLATCIGALAIGMRRAGLARAWFVWVTGFVAIAMATTACSFAASDAFSPDVQQQVLFQLLIIWLILSGVGSRSAPTRGRHAVGSAR
jgi:hypothetical protein